MTDFTPSVQLGYVTLLDVDTFTSTDKRVQLRFVAPSGSEDTCVLLENYAQKQNLRKLPFQNEFISLIETSLRDKTQNIPMYFFYDYGTITRDDRAYRQTFLSIHVPFMCEDFNPFVVVTLGMLVPAAAEFAFDRLYDAVNLLLWNFTRTHLVEKGRGPTAEQQFRADVDQLWRNVEQYLLALDTDNAVEPLSALLTGTPPDAFAPDPHVSFVSQDSVGFLSAFLFGHLTTHYTIVIPTDGRNIAGIKALLTPFSRFAHTPHPTFSNTIAVGVNPLFSVSFLMDVPPTLETDLPYPFCVVDTQKEVVLAVEPHDPFNHYARRLHALSHQVTAQFRLFEHHEPIRLSLVERCLSLDPFCNQLARLITEAKGAEAQVFVLKTMEIFRMKAYVLSTHLLANYRKYDLQYFELLLDIFGCCDLQDLSFLVYLLQSKYPVFSHYILKDIGHAISKQKHKFNNFA